MTKITNMEQFVAKHFDEHTSDYALIEAKILNSFLRRLATADFTFVSVYDGEDRHAVTDNDRFEVLDVIFSVDSSALSLYTPAGKKFVLVLVLGNEDATTIADHNIDNEEDENLIMGHWAAAVKTHSTELYELNWSGMAE